MPYKDNSELPPGVKDNLPEAAQTVYRKAFNSAYEGTCKGEDECSAKVAWSAVKNGWEKQGDKWVRKSSALAECYFYITKAYVDRETGESRWAATCSNTQKDSYDTKMSLELFKDFIQRIKDKEQAPEAYRSEFWSGGLPYLSVAHYEDLGGWAAAGTADLLYIDGEYLKAKGTFSKNAVGQAVFRSIVAELGLKPEKPIRISIAFLDYGHKHGNINWERKSLSDKCPMCLEGLNEKEFNRGLLVQLAVTRIPANEDTDIGLEGRSMLTRKDDAESIIGEELAKKLDTESILVGKSQAMENPVATSDVLVVRAEEIATETPSDQKKSVVEAEARDIPVDTLGGEKGSPESVDYPMGGAVTLADAVNYLKASNQAMLIGSLWTYAEECLYNILQRPDVTDKLGAQKKLLAEVSAEWKKMEGTAIQKESQAVVVSDLLDESLSAFRSKVVEIRGNPQLPAPEDKLVALQEHFEAFGEAVKKSFMLPEEKKEPTKDEELLRSMRELVGQNQKLAQEVAQLRNMVQASQIGGVSLGVKPAAVSVVPQRRSFQRPPVQAPVPTGLPNKLSVHQIVRRNAGLPE